MSQTYKTFVTLISDHIKKLHTAIETCRQTLERKEQECKLWLSVSQEKMEIYNTLPKSQKKSAIRPREVLLPERNDARHNANDPFSYMIEVYKKNNMHEELKEIDELSRFLQFADYLVTNINMFGNVSVCDEDVIFLHRFLK